MADHMHVVLPGTHVCDICGVEHPAAPGMFLIRTMPGGSYLNSDLGRGWVNSYEAVAAWTTIDAEVRDEGHE